MSERGHTALEIESAGHGSSSTVYRTRQRFVEEGLNAALSEAPRPGRKRLLDEKQEAVLVATACSPPPKGCAHWTLRLLAGRFVELADLESISPATIGRRLHEKDIKPWQKTMWCIPEVNADFVAHMEDVLELYAEPCTGRDPRPGTRGASPTLASWSGGSPILGATPESPRGGRPASSCWRGVGNESRRSCP